MKRTLYTLLASVLLLTSCFKDVDENTLYIIKPMVQTSSGGLNEPLGGVAAYAFVADTTNWTVASYEEALQGIITSKNNPSEKISTPVAEALGCDTEGMTDRIQLSLPPQSLMLVAIDTANRLYAYTQVEMEQNIGSLYVTLIFKTWKNSTAWKEGWSFYAPFYTPTVTLESFVKVAAQADPNAEVTTIQNVKVMAFAADTTEWRIASYDDAIGGVLTSKADTLVKRTNPEFNGYETNEKGTFRMNVSASPLMLVVIDRTHRLYAYSKQEIDFEAASSPTFSILFRLWRMTWITEEDGWRVVNPEYEPQTEEQPSDETQS